MEQTRERCAAIVGVQIVAQRGRIHCFSIGGGRRARRSAGRFRPRWRGCRSDAGGGRGLARRRCGPSGSRRRRWVRGRRVRRGNGRALRPWTVRFRRGRSGRNRDGDGCLVAVVHLAGQNLVPTCRPVRALTQPEGYAKMSTSIGLRYCRSALLIEQGPAPIKPEGDLAVGTKSLPLQVQLGPGAKRARTRQTQTQAGSERRRGHPTGSIRPGEISPGLCAGQHRAEHDRE